MAPAPNTPHRSTVFRIAVIAWFAALLGGGLYVMPSGIHQRIAEAAGMGDLIHSRQRLIITLVAALVGALVGFFIAGRRGPAGMVIYDDDGDMDEGVAVPDEEVEAPQRRRVFNPREDIAEYAIAAPHHHAAGDEDGAEAEWEETSAAPAPEADPEIAPAPAQAAATEPEYREPLGDLPLSALTERLARALSAAPSAHVPGTSDDSAQASLRDALDKLERASR